MENKTVTIEIPELVYQALEFFANSKEIPVKQMIKEAVADLVEEMLDGGSENISEASEKFRVAMCDLRAESP